MKSLVKSLAPRFVRSYFAGIQNRLNDHERALADIDFVLTYFLANPRYSTASDRAFNAQQFRRRIFRDLIGAIRFDAIVETGTWTGETTGYMAENSGLPIHSCELNPRLQALAKIRLSDMPGIRLECADSRAFLNRLSDEGLCRQTVLFYLDAHSYGDLPLPGEIEIIGRAWKDFVLIVDDFQVPDDVGYTYDTYGSGETLCLELIDRQIREFGLLPFFPSASSRDETGHKRGCVVLAPRKLGAERLSTLGSLRRASDR